MKWLKKEVNQGISVRLPDSVNKNGPDKQKIIDSINELHTDQCRLITVLQSLACVGVLHLSLAISGGKVSNYLISSMSRTWLLTLTVV